jgi:hypothetical protein
VKSRFATDCDRGFPVRKVTLDAFDFLVVVFLNIGRFAGGKDGSTGASAPEFFTLPAKFIREHHDTTSSWHKVRLRGLDKEIARYKDEAGFELIAKKLGVEKPRKRRAT